MFLAPSWRVIAMECKPKREKFQTDEDFSNAMSAWKEAYDESDRVDSVFNRHLLAFAVISAALGVAGGVIALLFAFGWKIIAAAFVYAIMHYVVVKIMNSKGL